MINNRLTSKEMAQFVASGYLKFEDMVPKDLCDACLEEMRHHKGYLAVGAPFEETWPKGTALGDAFRLPQVKGLIHSLVGPEPLYDHHFPHLTKARNTRGPDMHQDSVLDFRENYFDIQLSLFPADTPDEMGGTFLVPGTQFRNAPTDRMAHYTNIRGQLPLTVKAGTIAFTHYDLWHGTAASRALRP